MTHGDADRKRANMGEIPFHVFVDSMEGKEKGSETNIRFLSQT